MPSPPLLEFDELIAEIPGGSPAGGSIPFATREKLEEDRKEFDPSTYEEGHPLRSEPAKKADWRGVARLAQQTLVGTSKDLLVAARLTEALTHENGFAGLRDGLRLMRLLVTECWDRLHPEIESEEDLEIRAAPFNWLDEPDRGARFPYAVRRVPIIQGGGVRYSWQQWKQSQTGQDGLTTADIERAVLASTGEHCREVCDDLDEVWQELDVLTRELSERLGREAPSLTGLRQAVFDCRALAQQILKKNAGDAPGEAESPGDAVGGGEGGGPVDAGAGGGGGSFAGRQVASRAQVYQQLAQAASLLRQLEPHSPIPYLIGRAVELGALPFPELMRELVRDSEVLATMNRELGIKPPPEE